jgi:rod shape determining protein RodA
MIAPRLTTDIDRPLLLTTVLLALIGIAFVFSATAMQTAQVEHGLYLKQFLWLGLALLGAAATAAVPYRVYEGKTAWLLYGIALALLALTLVIGHVGLGAQRWLGWGPLKFQPSELAKIAAVMVLASMLAAKRIDLTHLPTLFKALLAAGIPFLLVLKQPDLGTSLCFIMVVLTMLYWAGLPMLYLFLLLSPILIGALSFYLPALILFALVLALVLYRSRLRLWTVVLVVVVNLAVGIATPHVWHHLEPYQRQRIATFLDPSADPYGAGYQIIQSKIAIGSGGVAGKGFMHGTQKGLEFLPEQHTDFIFSVVGEETGFLGAAFVTVLYMVLILRGVRIARRARNRFGSLLVIGLTAVFLYHVLVNVCMTVGLAPVTGLPLPLLSYGGTSLLTSFLQIGLMQNVAMRWREY